MDEPEFEFKHFNPELLIITSVPAVLNRGDFTPEGIWQSEDIHTVLMIMTGKGEQYCHLVGSNQGYC